MGKHAQYSKRGSSVGIGLLPPPLATDWTRYNATADGTSVSLTVPIPAGADRWGVMAIQSSTNIPASTIVSIGTTFSFTTLAPGTSYRVVAAWFKTSSNIQVSEWSPPKTFSTLT